MRYASTKFVQKHGYGDGLFLVLFKLLMEFLIEFMQGEIPLPGTQRLGPSRLLIAWVMTQAAGTA